jgi:predicted metalloprotease
MRWQGRRQSDNVEDRRGQGGLGGMGSGPRIGFGIPGGGGRGGLSIGVLIVIVIVALLAGVDPMKLLGGGDGSLSPSQVTEQSGETGVPSDEEGKFVATVLADTEDTWGAAFNAAGEKYPPPTLVLFSGQTASACGFASAAVGPFYCPNDRKLYIDLDFYRELSRKLNAPGDFAEAYVIAHEVGHHIQNLLGTLPQVDQARRAASSEAESNALSIRLELQADCYAGIWAHAAQKKGLLEVGDIDEALNAAAAVGDDTIQRRTQGYVVPESFNHGTSEQRSRWFKRGFQSGNLADCDTFRANPL